MCKWLCVAPDGRLEIWRSYDYMAWCWEICCRTYPVPEVEIFEARWKARPPEFWGRQIIEEWVE